MELFEHLAWDSSFFGFPVASVVQSGNINIDFILSSLKDKEYYLVYLFVPQFVALPENRVIKKFGGLLVDKKITYRYSFSGNKQVSSSPNIKINKFLRVNSTLAELAIRSGIYSRFNTDPNFNKELFRKMYLEWIKNSVSGKIADYVITYHTQSEPEGLVTLKINRDFGKIGLVSVSENMQGKGVGTCLLNEVFTICIREKLKYLDVVTQEENIPASRLYEKNGFKKFSLEYVYHFWLRKNDTL